MPESRDKPAIRAVESIFQAVEANREEWLRSMNVGQRLADDARQLMESMSASATARRVQEGLRVQEDAARKLAGSLDRLREQYSLAHTGQRYLDAVNGARLAAIRLDAIGSGIREFATQFDKIGSDARTAAARLDQFTSTASAAASQLRSMDEGFKRSLERVRKLLDDDSLAERAQRMLDGFKAAERTLGVPDELVNYIGTLGALQERFGQLSLPVIDKVSADTLATILGKRGVDAQLAEIGVKADGRFVPPSVSLEERDSAISRRSPGFWVLLNLILAIIPLWQGYLAPTAEDLQDLRMTVAERDLAVRDLRQSVDHLATLVEQAWIDEMQRDVDRFVVRERVANVRSKPESSAAVDGKLLPLEVVHAVADGGKWVQVEYYHWLHQEYRLGWVLKKYLQRVPANHLRRDRMRGRPTDHQTGRAALEGESANQ